MSKTKPLDAKTLRRIEEAANEAVRRRQEIFVRRRAAEERKEKRRVKAGIGASFLGVDGSRPPTGVGAYTDPGGGGVADTPTPPPLFLPPPAHVVYNDEPDDRPVQIAWAPQAGPQYHFIHCPVTDVAFGGSRGGGKSLRKSQKVRGHRGNAVSMGDLSVGDQILHPCGAAQTVTGVYPQGVLPVWRFRLENGLVADSSADHLWRIGPGLGIESWWPAVVVTTDDIRKRIEEGLPVYIPVLRGERSWDPVRVRLVEPAGEDECVCITVSGYGGLFALESGIVTHNSDALIGDAAVRAGKYGEGFRGLFLRRQQVELADIKLRMQSVYGLIGAKWSEQHQTWTFPGGGTLVLKYLANDDDALLYKGWSISALYVDEIGDFPSRRPIDLLWGAMRSAKGVPIVRRMSCNPGGAGHMWVKQLYLSHGPYRVFKHEPNPEIKGDPIDAVFIPSRLEDNKILMENDPRYESRIAASVGGDRALWKAWRYGDWDVLAGTYFNFDEKVHVCVPPPMPGYLPRWMAIDWGYTHQTAALWAADFGDRAYVYRERGYTNTDPISLGMYLAEVNGDEPVENVYLSPDAFAHRTGENTVATDLHEGFRRAHEMRGCALLPAPEPAFNDRVNGWQTVASGLQHGRLVIAPSCTELIRTLPSMVRDPKKPNDIQKVDGDDFCLAAGTLVLMADGTERRIEDVEEGDVLETPCGPGVVSAAGCTAEDAELMEVVLEDGRALTGTPGHHLYDGPTGEKRAIAILLPGDTILVWAPQANQSSTPAASSAATRPPSPRAGGITSGPDTEPRRGFTGRSGQTPTAPSRPGLSSTTSMGTPPTTASKTSPLSPAERMRESTGGSSAWPTVENESGVRAAGPNSSTGPDTEAGYSAGTLASRRTDGEPSWTTSKEPARAVPPHSGRVSTNPPGTARVVALRRLTERGSVYNLTVDCCHKYYANGILSANCDGLRYLWATRRRGEVYEPIEVRAVREVNAVDPNHRAMQERLFLAREGAVGEPQGGVILRGRMRPSRWFE